MSQSTQLAAPPGHANILVRVMGPVWGLPSASPFCLKLETWLRLAGLAYEARPVERGPRSRTGKVPYVEREGGEVLVDSSHIIATLTEERGVTLDAWLDPALRAEALAWQRLVEEHLYWGVVWERWERDAGFALTGPAYFAPVPAPLRGLVAGMIRRQVRKSARGHGLGRLRHDEVIARVRADLAALAARLGDQPYMLGDQPCTLDAVVYGVLENVRGAAVQADMAEALAGHANLVAWLDRVRARCWPELSAG